ncbi:hypothetical protein CT0861_01577 [Colletotrichum tofieldiae]|uniref:Uncharacterized protein n=1 Tax=Colletotrichum tofieldiae TaxID=708197 RepID=A0A166NFS6_9PEZI|nr:hypothetical protein CT0861_01577 [Colletotrichum tofieldiae]
MEELPTSIPNSPRPGSQLDQNTDFIVEAWSITTLQDILGADRSPQHWSGHLLKSLRTLSRGLKLDDARPLLIAEINARLKDPSRNHGPRRDFLTDIDVRRVVAAKNALVPPVEQHENAIHTYAVHAHALNGFSPFHAFSVNQAAARTSRDPPSLEQGR